jgi:cytochrome bd-type quinol oxidase subunit 1
MKVLLDRWQFGVTITYHFLFVPLIIGPDSPVDQPD